MVKITETRYEEFSYVFICDNCGQEVSITDTEYEATCNKCDKVFSIVINPIITEKINYNGDIK